jgi:8-oxo-dGTP pyrophosphatase MutT (NUDIX family)
MDPGETVEQCARRELLEETGYEPGKLVLLGTVHPNPSIQSNRQHYVLATGCRKVAELDLDHAEDIAVRLAPLAGIPDMIRAGRITHGIVIGGFYWLDLCRGANR